MNQAVSGEKSLGFFGWMLAIVLTACAAPSIQQPGVPRTESDQTDADRRSSVRMELAAGYFARGQFNIALDEIKQALLVKPELREAINLRGLVYAAMGESQLAEESFKSALRLYPRDADILHNYGWMLCQQQRWPDAQVQFDLALAQASYRAPSRTLLAKGVCQARSGRMVEAELTLAQAFELDPASPAVAVNLAEVLYRNNKLERARFYIKRVVSQKEPSNASSLWLALRIEKRLGNNLAVDEYSQVLRRGHPQSPETQALENGKFYE